MQCFKRQLWRHVTTRGFFRGQNRLASWEARQSRDLTYRKYFTVCGVVGVVWVIACFDPFDVEKDARPYWEDKFEEPETSIKDSSNDGKL